LLSAFLSLTACAGARQIPRCLKMFRVGNGVNQIQSYYCKMLHRIIQCALHIWVVSAALRYLADIWLA
jgi:hypothetical protein